MLSTVSSSALFQKTGSWVLNVFLISGNLRSQGFMAPSSTFRSWGEGVASSVISPYIPSGHRCGNLSEGPPERAQSANTAGLSPSSSAFSGCIPGALSSLCGKALSRWVKDRAQPSSLDLRSHCPPKTGLVLVTLRFFLIPLWTVGSFQGAFLNHDKENLLRAVLTKGVCRIVF